MSDVPPETDQALPPPASGAPEPSCARCEALAQQLAIAAQALAACRKAGLAIASSADRLLG